MDDDDDSAVTDDDDIVDDDDTGTIGDDDDSAGPPVIEDPQPECGCESTGGADPSWLALLLLAGILRRPRRK